MNLYFLITYFVVLSSFTSLILFGKLRHSKFPDLASRRYRTSLQVTNKTLQNIYNLTNDNVLLPELPTLLPRCRFRHLST